MAGEVITDQSLSGGETPTPDEAWTADKGAAKEAIRRLFAATPTTALHRNEIIEQVTGIKVLSAEEQRRLQVCEEALSELWGAHELELADHYHLTLGYGFKTPPPEDPEAPA